MRGSEQTIRKCKPPLVIELSPCLYGQGGMDRLCSGISATRFRTKSSAKPLPLDARALEQLIPDGAAMNALAIPG